MFESSTDRLINSWPTVTRSNSAVAFSKLSFCCANSLKKIDERSDENSENLFCFSKRTLGHLLTSTWTTNRLRFRLDWEREVSRWFLWSFECRDWVVRCCSTNSWQKRKTNRNEKIRLFVVLLNRNGARRQIFQLFAHRFNRTDRRFENEMLLFVLDLSSLFHQMNFALQLQREEIFRFSEFFLFTFPFSFK